MSTIVGQQAVLRLIQSKQATSQIELARALDLPSNTVHGIVKRLIAEGVIAEFRQGRGGRGRPALHFSIRRPGKVLVIIWWGSEWQGTVVGEGVEEEVTPVFLRTSAVPDFETTRKSFVKVRNEILDRSRLRLKNLDGAIVMLNTGEMGGSAHRVSSVIPYTAELTEDTLRKWLGCETMLSKNIHLAELELRRWTRDQVRSLVRFNVGDGVSAHYAAMGRSEMHVAAGEIGHCVRRSDGDVCGCGNRGCLETLISGPRLISRVRRDMSFGMQSVLAESLSKSPREFFADLERADIDLGDAYARTVIEEFLEHCAWGISMAVNMFQPDVVVLSGYALARRPAWQKHLASILPNLVLWAHGSAPRIENERQQAEDHLRELATEFLLRKKFHSYWI